MATAVLDSGVESATTKTAQEVGYATTGCSWRSMRM